MIKDYLLSINQIRDRRIWKPVLWSTLLTSLILLLFIFIGFSTGGWIFEYLISYFDFLEEDSWFKILIRIIISVFLLVLGFFFFGSIQAGFLGLFIDDVIDAIKERHYPNLVLKSAPPLITSVIISTRLIFLSLAINLIATPLFIIGWFFPPIGFGLQIFINGYLLGKEYKTIVDCRLPNEFTQNKQSFTFYGCLGSAIWIVPILNLFAPILICASVFHARIRHQNLD